MRLLKVPGARNSACQYRLAQGLGSRDSVPCICAGYPQGYIHTNAIENINSPLRKIITTRGHFPTDDAAAKLIWLALRNITDVGALYVKITGQPVRPIKLAEPGVCL
jgi:hypothetical protein